MPKVGFLRRGNLWIGHWRTALGDSVIAEHDSHCVLVFKQDNLFYNHLLLT